VWEAAAFFGDEAEMSEVGDVGGSVVKELGALGDKSGVSFACCNDEEATGEAGALVVAVIVVVFPTGALDLRRGATMGDGTERYGVQ